MRYGQTDDRHSSSAISISIHTDAVFAIDGEEVAWSTAALVTTDGVCTLVLTAAVVDSALIHV